jgi:signal transduction histidine kinase
MYREMKDSSAFYLNQYSNLKDEKLKASVLEQTSELETKYQTAEKEKQLLQKEAETKKKTTTIIILSLLTFFIAIVGFLIYRQQRLKNTQQKQEFELQTAIAQIENQNKLHEQRLSISRDLHDNIGAQLTFIISSVENLKFGFPTMDVSVKNHLSRISDFTKTTIVELRDTIWAMNANEFTFDDLSSRIYNFIEKAQTAKENTTFKFTIDESLKAITFSSLEGINLYRTIQEAVNNAIKYADATEITVQVEGNVLTIIGESMTTEYPPESYLYRGLATRDFVKEFPLAEHIEVKGAEIENGMLNIRLTRNIPESAKPKVIDILEIK